MALGIWEPKGDPHSVPGTVLRDVPGQESVVAQQQNDAGLKRDKSGKHILVPQPSDDPNDPLVCTKLAPREHVLKYSRTGLRHGAIPSSSS